MHVIFIEKRNQRIYNNGLIKGFKADMGIFALRLFPAGRFQKQDQKLHHIYFKQELTAGIAFFLLQEDIAAALQKVLLIRWQADYGAGVRFDETALWKALQAYVAKARLKFKYLVSRLHYLAMIHSGIAYQYISLFYRMQGTADIVRTTINIKTNMVYQTPT